MVATLVKISGGAKEMDVEDTKVDNQQPDVRGPVAMELAMFGSTECSSVAHVLLNLMLEMFGASCPCPNWRFPCQTSI
jgi:hypothetical protein